MGDHEFWQDGSVHGFQSLLIAFVSDLLPRQVRAINEFQSLFSLFKNVGWDLRTQNLNKLSEKTGQNIWSDQSESQKLLL